MSSGIALEVEGGRWKRYPAYRDSGVEWLGAVPDGWGVKRVDAFTSIFRHPVSAESLSGREVFHYSIPIVQETGTGQLEDGGEIESNKTLISEQVLLVSKLNPRKGTIVLASPQQKITVCSGEFVPIVPRQCVPKYLEYVYHCKGVRQLLSSRVESVTRSHQRVNPTEIYKMFWSWPPLLEQHAITAFLDHETGRIDALIAKKERQIKLLREKRAAFISHAVTKGLDPDAPTKDSGVEWLGEVPEHWNILALRRVVSRFVDYRGKTPEKVDRGVPLITSKNIKDGHVDLSQSQEFMREDEYQDWMTRGWPEIGDVLITTEAPLGAVAQVEDTFIALAQRIILLKVNKSRIINDYLKYHFLSMSGQGELWTRASGSTALGIKAERFKGTLVSVPPLNEQQKITRYLDSEISRLEIPSSKIHESITKLREYRTAIISAAVTGKIDVREGSSP